jgi:hypothetical protein
MPRSKCDQPSYRYHIGGQAVVTFCGKNFYLGPHDAPESKARYHVLLAEYIKNGKTAPPSAETHQADAVVTIACIVVDGNCRKYVNQQTRNVVRIFKHSVSRELVKPDQLVALQSLEPLRFGHRRPNDRSSPSARSLYRREEGFSGSLLCDNDRRPSRSRTPSARDSADCHYG